MVIRIECLRQKESVQKLRYLECAKAESLEFMNAGLRQT